jgi:hypothetical protein
VRILAAEVPDAPGTPVKSSASKTQITIRWTAPPNNGGVLITQYNVYVKPDGESYTVYSEHSDMYDLTYTLSVLTEDIGRSFHF